MIVIIIKVCEQILLENDEGFGKRRLKRRLDHKSGVAVACKICCTEAINEPARTTSNNPLIKKHNCFRYQWPAFFNLVQAKGRAGSRKGNRNYLRCRRAGNDCRSLREACFRVSLVFLAL